MENKMILIYVEGKFKCSTMFFASTGDAIKSYKEKFPLIKNISAEYQHNVGITKV